MTKERRLITAARYLGSICPKHVESAGVRYKKSHACVACVAANQYKWAKNNPDSIKRIVNLSRSKARVKKSYEANDNLRPLAWIKKWEAEHPGQHPTAEQIAEYIFNRGTMPYQEKDE